LTEIVTFAHYIPDPDWRGWLIYDKSNFYDFRLINIAFGTFFKLFNLLTRFSDVINLPNSSKTSAIPRQKEKVDEADEFRKEEIHSNYNIWSGERDYVRERRRDYYHKGWNYGGTQESESIAGTGGLEFQMKKLDIQESRHASLGKQRLTGKGMPIRLDGKFWDLHYQRKRAHINHQRNTGKLPKKTHQNVWAPGRQRPT